VRVRPLIALLVGLLVAAGLIGASTKAEAGRTCVADAGAGGYSYAGHQATHAGHGVRATITMTRAPSVEAGHVAGWVGLGGPEQGANGEDAWIQAGITSMPGLDPMIYVEIVRSGRAPEFMLIEEGVAPGRPHELAVLEMAGRRDWWRAWVDGQAVTDPVRIAGSSGRWAPIATAETWNSGTGTCNAFAFRFERVSVSYGGGGSWRPFVSGHRFQNGANVLRDLATARAQSGVYRRTLAVDGDVVPYAFAAASG
jgi:hypothetical protein